MINAINVGLRTNLYSRNLTGVGILASSSPNRQQTVDSFEAKRDDIRFRGLSIKNLAIEGQDIIERELIPLIAAIRTTVENKAIEKETKISDLARRQPFYVGLEKDIKAFLSNKRSAVVNKKSNLKTNNKAGLLFSGIKNEPEGTSVIFGDEKSPEKIKIIFKPLKKTSYCNCSDFSIDVVDEKGNSLSKKLEDAGFKSIAEERQGSRNHLDNYDNFSSGSHSITIKTTFPPYGIDVYGGDGNSAGNKTSTKGMNLSNLPAYINYAQNLLGQLSKL